MRMFTLALRTKPRSTSIRTRSFTSPALAILHDVSRQSGYASIVHCPSRISTVRERMGASMQSRARKDAFESAGPPGVSSSLGPTPSPPPPLPIRSLSSTCIHLNLGPTRVHACHIGRETDAPPQSSSVHGRRSWVSNAAPGRCSNGRQGSCSALTS
ncbi:hypothetical protein OH77DRAFT_101404 [Trametes cingulata]|nr:hypothetical protein OH77DRAFT_101404 [Trametes cingulata]